MEASALTSTARGGLLTRRSPLIRFEPDERLVLGRVWERVLAADEADAAHSSGNTSG